MIRSAVVLLGGVVAAVIVVTVMDALVGRLFSLPPGTDPSDPESFRRAVAALPFAAFALLLAGWTLAAGVGSYVAARFAAYARPTHGLIVALFVLVATATNLVRIPHPMWLWPATIVLIPAAGWMATKLVAQPGLGKL